MLYQDIFDTINLYLLNIQIINEHIFKYRCSQCRDFFPHYLLKETNEQSSSRRPRVYCSECRILLKRYCFFSYKKFK